MTKTLLITGANRGIGLALTERYLNQGWHVVACCRHPGSAPHLSALKSKYPALDIHALDVTDHRAVTVLADSLKNLTLDLLINNAGYYGPKGYSFGKTDAEEWRKVLEINTIAPLKIAEAFFPHLDRAQSPIMAFLSSKVGSMADNSSGGGYIYRSSKAALNSVVKSLSLDLQSYGIKAVALHPSWVQTEMGGPNALISTKESADALFNLLDRLTQEDSGKFFNYNGDELPW